ncbi:MAG: hypothetical protein R2911_11010 [Caldilineaceae bacterium]
MRYMLKRRGVFTPPSSALPAGAQTLDAADKREISVQIEAIQDLVDFYPFGAE